MARSSSITVQKLIQAGVDDAYLTQKYGDAYKSFSSGNPTKKVEEFIKSHIRTQEDRENIMLERRIQSEFDTVTGRLTTNLQTNIDNLNKARDELLNNMMLQAGVDATLLTGRYGAAYNSFNPIDSAKKVEEFIAAKDASGRYYISMDEKLAIIAERTNNDQIFSGSDKFSADLSDTQKIKAENKKTYRAQAEEIERHLESVVAQNQKLIGQLEENIEKYRAQLATLEAKIIAGPGKTSTMGANGTVITAERTDADVQKEQQQKDEDIKALKETIEEEVKKLNRLRDEHNLYVAECSKRKNELNEMLNKGKIFSNSEQEGARTEESKSAEILPAVGSKTVKTEKDLAKSMLRDFYNRSPEEQNVILERCGSKDLLNAALKAGIRERRKLARVLKARMEDLTVDVTVGSTTVTKEELQGRRGLARDTVKDLQKEIADFNNAFDSKTPEEIKEFEKQIQYIRFASYLQETRWFRPLTRIFDGFNKKNYRTFELSKTLARYATIKNERERNQLARLNKWRKTLKLNPVNEIAVTNPRALDRTGTNDINRQDYTQEL